MSPPTPRALEGIRVLDLSRVLAGPWATQALGDMGAEVIKIERPGVGDDTRSWGPPFLTAHDGSVSDAAYFLAANRNKKSVAVDFTKPAGQALVRSMVPRCQILVENFKTGGLAKYGLDYEALKVLNPGLVYCSITGFGQTGPYAERAGYDYIIQAMAGLMSVTGQPDGAPGAEPMKVGVAVADLFTGLYAVSAILAALRHAERTGEGQHLDVALFDVQAAVLANQAMNWFVGGEVPKRMGNAHPNIVPYQVFEVADGHLVLAIGNDGQFRAFCKVAGIDRLAEDPDFASGPARLANRARLVREVASVMRSQSQARWIQDLEQAGVPCGPINTIDQVFASPNAVARGLSQELVRPDVGPITLTPHPVKFSATPTRMDAPPPRLGADTETVLSDVAGLDAAGITALRNQGVVG